MTKIGYKTLIIALILMLAGLKVYSQKAFLFGADATVPKNDQVVIRLQGYVGNIQWQKALELNGKDNWINIPDATLDSLVFIADTTTFFRAQVTSGHCEPFYSDTTFISVYKQNENVFLVSDEELTLISDSTQLANGIFVFDGDASGIEIGSVLVSSIGEGYMRMVTGIQSKSRNSIVLETEQAVITDVIQEMQLSDSLVFTFDNDGKKYAKAKPVPVELLYLIEGAKIKPDRSGFDLSGVSFNIAIEDENSNFSGSITATITEGHINFQPVFQRQLEISWLPPRVNKFKLLMGGNIDFDMDVSLEAEVGYSLDTTYTVNLATIGPIFIGPVPMFIKLSLDLSFEAGLFVSGEMTFGFESDYNAFAGASYVRTNSPVWEPLFYSNGSFNPKPFDFSFNANAYAQLGVAPKAGVKIAGVAGPELAIEPYLRADANASWPWDWDFAVSAGVDASLGFEVGILSHSLLKFEHSIEGPSWTIFEVNGEYEHTVPVVETLEVTSISHNSAQGGGNVTIEGSSEVTARGVVWNTSENPTTDSNLGITSNETGSGSFTSSITGLTHATTYYVRAYATNNAGTSYGEQQQFTTLPIAPSVTTNSITSIFSNKATGGGSVTATGGATVTARGVVWSTTENPTIIINSGITNNGGGSGGFTSSITGLTPTTTYYVRAYATNSVGTSYGNQESFITSNLLEGEVLNPVTGKIWMDRNLGANRVAQSSNDTEAYGDLYQWGRATDGHEKINSGTTTTQSNSDTPGHGLFILATANNSNWRSPHNPDLWQGVNGINNPCPTGFRLPTIEEWEAERLSWSSNDADGAFDSPLKLTVAGDRSNVDGTLISINYDGNYWSSSVSGATSWGLYFGSSYATTYQYYRALGRSVRCIKE